MADSENNSLGGYRLNESGESLGAVSEVLGATETAFRPSYSGGGKNCCLKKKKGSEKKKSEGHASDSDMSVESMKSARSSKSEIVSRPKTPARKRRKGTPSEPSSSESECSQSPSILDAVNISSKRTEFLKEKKQAVELMLEERAQEISAGRAALRLQIAGDDETQTTEALNRIVMNDVAMVCEVATKSKNLKGTLQRALKDSASSIAAVVEILLKRNTIDANARLLADNVRLRGEVASMKQEMIALKKEVEKVTKTIPTAQPQPLREGEKDAQSLLSQGDDRLEELSRKVMLQVGNMVNARLEAFADRLPPEKRLRPPLAADRRNAAAATFQLTHKSAETLDKPSKPVKMNTAKSGKKQMGTKQVAAEAPPKKAAPRSLPPAPESMDLEWSAVAKRGKKTMATPQSQITAMTAKPRSHPASVKLRPPRSSAVVVKLQPGAVEKGVTYAAVMREARQKVDLASCGISGLRFRKAATGAYILEVQGAASGDKADSLAQKLRSTLGEDIAAISRPEKRADLRVSGLDDSVSAEDVVAAIVRRGGCTRESISHGELRSDFQGTYSLFVRCPVAAAKRLGNGERLLVGWISTQVRVLEPRPRRCFRCLNVGHIRAQCTAEIDRSDECYRCGQTGHKAVKCCASAAQCSLCTAANRPAQHRLGSKSCCPPKPKRGPKAAVPAAEAPAATSRLPEPEGGEGAMICN